MPKNILFVMAVVEILSGLSSNNNLYAKKQTTIKMRVPIQLQFKDPSDLLFVEEWELYNGIVEPLLKPSSTGEFISAGISESFFVVGKELKIKLRPGAMFSNGIVIKPEDVKKNIKRLVILTERKSSVLSKCLLEKKINTMKDKLYSVVVMDDGTISLKMNSRFCINSIIKQLMKTNAGMVYPPSINNDGTISELKIITGRFNVEFNNKATLLKINPNHWQSKTSKHGIHIEFLFLDQDEMLLAVANRELDVSRTYSQVVYDKSKEKGYFTRISLPIMSWYLSAKLVPTEIHQDALDFIKKNIAPKNMPYLKNNRLESPSSTFFPPDFACSGKLISKGGTR